MGIILTIGTVIKLIERHIGTAKRFVALATDGIATITRDDGTPIPAAEVDAAIAHAWAQRDVTSANAAARIDARHGADGTGQP